MRVHSSYFIDAIFNRLPGIILPIWLSLLLASCSLTGGAEPEIPEDVRVAVRTLGENTPVMAGLRVSDTFRSFMAGIPDHAHTPPLPFLNDPEDQIFWNRLGIDLDTDDVSIFLGADPASASEGPEIVFFAPTDPERIRRLTEDWEGAEKLGDSPSSFRIDTDGHSVFLSIPDDGIVIVTPSEKELARMLSSLLDGSSPVSIGDDSILNRLVTEQAWIIVRDIQGLLANLSLEGIPQQAKGLLRAVETAGFSAEFEADRINLNALIEPRADIAAEDLASLLEGAIALIKLSKDVPDAFIELIDGLRISIDADRVRARLRLTAEDLNSVATAIADR